MGAKRAIALLLLSIMLRMSFSKKTIRLDEKNGEFAISLKEEHTYFELDLDNTIRNKKYLNIHLLGPGEIEVKIGKGKELKTLCTGNWDFICVLDLATATKDGLLLQNPTLYVGIAEDAGKDSLYSIIVEASNLVTVAIDTATKIFIKKFDNLEVIVKGKVPAGSGIRFMAKGTKSEGASTLRGMFESGDNPAITDSKATRLNNLYQDELASIVYPKDKNYCLGGESRNINECSIRLSFETAGYHYIDFRVSTTQEIQHIYLNEDYFDELHEMGMIRKYSLPITEDIIGSSLKIELIPISGDSRLYANPNIMPLYTRQCKYSAAHQGAKVIRIDASDIYSKIQKSEIIYIVVEAMQSTAFYIKASILTDSEFLRPNVPVNGFVAGKDYKHFFIRKSTLKDSETFSATIEVSMTTGEADIYAMSCASVDKCKISETTHEDKANLIKGVIYDETKASHKKLTIVNKCGKETATFSILHTEDVIEYFCDIAIAVYGVETAANGANFQIAYINPGFHFLMHTKKTYTQRLSPNEKRLYVYNLNIPKGKVLESINFNFGLSFGSLIVYTSETNRDPCEKAQGDETFQELKYSDAEGMIHGLSTIFHPKSITSSKYFVCIKSSNYASYNLQVNPKLKADLGEESDVQLHDLPAGEQILGHIDSTGQAVYFTIDVTFDKRSGEELILSISSLRGSFLMVATDSISLPSRNQPYWSSRGGLLTIKSSDPNFIDKRKIIVGVWLENNPGGPGKFMISYTYTAHHIDLKPSIPQTIKLSDDKKASARIEVPVDNGHKMLTIMKTSDDPVMIYGSYTTKNAYPSSKEHNFLIPAYQNGVTLRILDIKKHSSCSVGTCIIYLHLEGWGKNERCHISYVFDEGYFTLLDGMPMALPFIPDYSPGLKLVHYGKSNTNMEISSQSRFEMLDIFVNYDNIHPMETVFPDRKHYKDMFLSIANREIKVVPEVESDEVLVKLLLLHHPYVFKSVETDHNRDPFSFSHNGAIEISSKMRTLMKGTPTRFTMLEGQWKYYQIQNSRDEEFTVEISNSGFARAMLYMNKGLTSHPDLMRHRLSSQSIYDSYLQMEFDELHNGESITGEYIIGIHCLAAGEFSLVWQSIKNKIITLSPGNPASIMVHPESIQYLQIPSSYIQADIELMFESSFADIRAYASPRVILESDPTQQALPDSNTFVWKASTGKKGGVGKLIIPQNHTKYCTNCEIIVAIESDYKEKVQFVAHKKNPSNFMFLYQDKSFPDTLKKGETQDYFFGVQFNEQEFSINLKILKGHVRIIYSTRSDFEMAHTHTFIANPGDDFFTVRLNTFANIWETVTNGFYRYIRIIALEDCDYEITMVRDHMLNNLIPGDSSHSYLIPLDVHYYIYKTQKDQDIDIELEVRNMMGILKDDYKYIGKYIKETVKIYSVSDYIDAVHRKFYHGNAVEFKMFGNHLRAQTKGNGNFLVLAVRNIFSKMMYYRLQANVDLKRKIELGSMYADDLVKDQKRLYKFDLPNISTGVRLQLNKCFKNTKAMIWYQKYGETDEKAKERAVEITQESITQLPSNGVGFIETSLVDVNQSRSVYSFELLRSTDKQLGTYIEADSYAEGKRALTISTNSIPVIAFKPVPFNNLKEILKEKNIVVNYTLYLSTDVQLLDDMAQCDNFDFDEVSQELKNPKSTTYTFVEYFGKQYNKLEMYDDSIYSFTTSMLGFGEYYNAKLVARVSIFHNTETPTNFPKAEHFTYDYETAGFTSVDFTVPLYLIFGIILLSLITFGGIYFYKIRGWEYWVDSPFLKSFLTEFNVQSIGDQLEFDVMSSFSNSREVLSSHEKDEEEHVTVEYLDTPSNDDSITQQPQSSPMTQDAEDEEDRKKIEAQIEELVRSKEESNVGKEIELM